MRRTLAKICYSRKQHFAHGHADSLVMADSRIVNVFAQCLRYHMTTLNITQAELAKRSGIGQTTISLYLRPRARGDTVSGKAGSPTLANVEALADALGVEVWELLRMVTPAERELMRAVAKMAKNTGHH
jgi:transcriptional regulator with XRE-family HTH domain